MSFRLHSLISNRLCRALLASGLLSLSLGASAAVEITIAHQLDDARASRLQQVVDRFNAEQKDYHVVLKFHNNGEAPGDLNLADRDNLSHFVGGKVEYKPLFQVLSDARVKVDLSRIAPALKGGVTDSRGRLVALPVAYSTPVLFYNKAAFRRAGLDAENPPKTWWQVQAAAGKLVKAGYSCPYTTSWPAWVHIDNVSARSGAEPVVHGTETTFNSMAQIKHIALLSSWYKAKYFVTFGRTNEADAHFAKGECGMLTSSSDLYASLRDKPDLEVGVAPLPYYDDIFGGARQALADGASLWVGPGRKPVEYKGVAKFVSFLMAPDMQLEISKAGGFLPLTTASALATRGKLLGADFANQQVAYSQLGGAAPRSAYSKTGSNLTMVSRIEPVRVIIDEELEAVWANKKPAKEALDDAVARSNAVLRSNRPLQHVATIR